MTPASRVHIVDDDASVRDALALLLSTAQIESRGYGSAEEFLASGAIGDAVCILLDIQLPGMSGVELLERVASSGSKAAVIMITAYPDVPTAVATMRMGAFHFVQKPFDAEALLLTIEEGIARSNEVADFQRDAHEIAGRWATLTRREQEVFALLAEGQPTKVIAGRLSITNRTAEHHRAAVMQKMQARTISHLVRMALRIERTSPL
ncbi:MAG: response regulator [Roseiarcus sp.]|jgi:FixJ family two-component response regulator